MLNDVYRTSFNQQLYGMRVTNVFYYQEAVSPVGGPGVENGINAQFANIAIPSYQAALSVNWRGDCIETVKLGAGGNSPRVLTLGPTIDGDRAGEAMPPNNVCSFTEYTAAYVKEGRGRHFISGFLLADEADNALLQTPFAGLADIAESTTQTLTDANGGQYVRVVLGGNPAVPRAVIKYIPHATIKKLRGRTQRVC